LWHPCKFQRVSRFGIVTARQSSSGRQPNFAALNRGCHLYSAGRPSRWALAHILVCYYIDLLLCNFIVITVFELFSLSLRIPVIRLAGSISGLSIPTNRNYGCYCLYRNFSQHSTPSPYTDCWFHCLHGLHARLGAIYGLPYLIGQAIIFFALWFLLCIFFFFSWPNLSGRRLDIYHASTHGVALVRI